MIISESILFDNPRQYWYNRARVSTDRCSIYKESTMSDLLRVGEVAPDFTLPGVITKPEVARLEIKLSDYRGRKNVVLAFHTFAFTAT